MTKKEALIEFKEYFLPEVIKQYGEKDIIAKRECWNNYTDSLCKDGLITQKQYNNWMNPY
jgi:hypothetical protein